MILLTSGNVLVEFCSKEDDMKSLLALTLVFGFGTSAVAEGLPAGLLCENKAGVPRELLTEAAEIDAAIAVVAAKKHFGEVTCLLKVPGGWQVATAS